MKRKKHISPMGRMGLINPISRIRPISLIGLMGLLSLTGCSDDSEAELARTTVELVPCAPSFVEEELILLLDDVVALDGRPGGLGDIPVAENHGNLDELGDLDGLGGDASALGAPECTLYRGLAHPSLEDLVLGLVIAIGTIEIDRLGHLSLQHAYHWSVMNGNPCPGMTTSA